MSGKKSKLKKVKDLKKKKKIIMMASSIGIVPILVIILIMAVSLVLVGIFGGGVEEDKDGNAIINTKLEDKYAQVQEDIMNRYEVYIPIKSLYAEDGVLRENDFSNDNKIEVNVNNSTCLFYEGDSGENQYNQSTDSVGKCFEWDEEQKSLYDLLLLKYEKIGRPEEFQGSFIRPTKSGIITNEFNGFDFNGSSDGVGHTGIDIAPVTEDSKTIYPIADGKVTWKGFDTDGGNCVLIRHNKSGDDYMSGYCHMKEQSKLEVGQEVSTEDVVGYMGMTGQAVTGVHLHLEIQKQDHYIHSKLENPRKYIDFPALQGQYNDRGQYEDIVSREHQLQMKKAGIDEKYYSNANNIIKNISQWDKNAIDDGNKNNIGVCLRPKSSIIKYGRSDEINSQLLECDNYINSHYKDWEEAESFYKDNGYI